MISQAKHHQFKPSTTKCRYSPDSRIDCKIDIVKLKRQECRTMKTAQKTDEDSACEDETKTRRRPDHHFNGDLKQNPEIWACLLINNFDNFWDSSHATRRGAARTNLYC